MVAVAFFGYLAAVYLAADSVHGADPALTRAFRARALIAGVVSGGVALAGLLVMRHSGLDLTGGLALVMVCVSALAGLATMALCWLSRFPAGPAVGGARGRGGRRWVGRCAGAAACSPA